MKATDPKLRRALCDLYRANVRLRLYARARGHRAPGPRALELSLRISNAAIQWFGWPEDVLGRRTIARLDRELGLDRIPETERVER